MKSLFAKTSCFKMCFIVLVSCFFLLLLHNHNNPTAFTGFNVFANTFFISLETSESEHSCM